MAPKNFPTSHEISGSWKTFDTSEDTPTAFAQLNFDDSSWDIAGDLSGPSDHVRRFRQRFKSEGSAQGRRSWLVFDIACSDAHVWLDGTYTGDVDGMIVPTAFDITDAVMARDEHVVALQIPRSAHVPGDAGSVRLEETGPVRISRLKTICTDASEEQATLSFWAELDARDTVEVTVRTIVGGIENELQRSLAAGRNRLRWNLVIDRPALWWPKGLGPAELSQAIVKVADPRHPHRVSDSHEFSVGFRDVEMSRGFLRVNGERVLVRACSAADVHSASGVNAVHCDDPSLTAKTLDFADHNGLIAIHQVFSDAKELRQSTEAFGYHPSLVAWTQPDASRSILRRKESTRRAMSRADPSRPQIRPLPQVKSLSQLDGLRRSRRLLNGYVLLGRDADLFAATSQALRISFSVRRTARRRDSQLIDVHLINDTAQDIAGAAVQTAAVWDSGEPKTWHWSSKASAASSSYVGTMPLPRHIPADELHLSWEVLNGSETVGADVTRRVGADGMILGVKKTEVTGDQRPAK